MKKIKSILWVLLLIVIGFIIGLIVKSISVVLDIIGVGLLVLFIIIIVLSK
jgi:hypothetical protein